MDSKSLKSLAGIFTTSAGGDILNMITRRVEKISVSAIRTSIIFKSYFYYGNNSGQIFKYYIGTNYSLKSLKSIYAHNDYVRKLKIYAHNEEYFLLSAGDDGLINILDLDLNIIGSISFKYNVVDFILLNFKEWKNEFTYGINFITKRSMHKNYACNLNLNDFYANLICITNVGMIPLFQFKKEKKLEDNYNKEPFLAIDTIFCIEEINIRGGDTILLIGGSYLHIYLYNKNRNRISLLKENKDTGEIFSIKAYDEDNIYACGDKIYKVDKNDFTIKSEDLIVHNFCNMTLFNVNFWTLNFLKTVEILHDRVQYSIFLFAAGDGGSVAYKKIKENEIFASNKRIFNFLLNKTENDNKKTTKNFLQEIMQSNIKNGNENILFKISNRAENIFSYNQPLIKCNKIEKIVDQVIITENNQRFSFLGRKIDTITTFEDFTKFQLEMPFAVKKYFKFDNLLIMQCDYLYIFDLTSEKIIFKSDEVILRAFIENSFLLILLSKSVSFLSITQLSTLSKISPVENSIKHNSYYQLENYGIFVYQFAHKFLNIISFDGNEITYIKLSGKIMHENITMHKNTLNFFIDSNLHEKNIEYLKIIGKNLHDRKLIFKILHCINNKTEQFNFLLNCNLIKEAELIEILDVECLSKLSADEIDDKIKINEKGNFLILKSHYIKNKDYANALRCFDILNICDSERDLLKILLN